MSRNSAPAPNRQEMLAHLEWIAGPALSVHPELRIEIAHGSPEEGPNKARTFALRDLYSAAKWAYYQNTHGSNVYVGALLKRPDAPPGGRTSAHDAALATCLPVDIDENFVLGARKLAQLTKPQLLVQTGSMPEPRGQLWVRIKATDDLGSWSELNSRAVHFCGGDRNALGRNRLMRLAGSVSYPPKLKQLRGYTAELTAAHFVNAPTYETAKLISTLPTVQNVRPIKDVRIGAWRSGIIARGPTTRKASAAQVVGALSILPMEIADDHFTWIRVGFALHDFDSSSRGLQLWQEFSAQCPAKAERTDFPKLWLSMDRPEYKGRKITIAWLFDKARQHGWRSGRR